MGKIHDFLADFERMCKAHDSCIGCPLDDDDCFFCFQTCQSSDVDIDLFIKKVKEWSREHPAMRNIDKLEEVFPDCPRLYMKDGKIPQDNAECYFDWLAQPYNESEE